MKRILLLFLFFLIQAVGAAELGPQFRLWKSSDLGLGEFTNLLVSSSTIIFHMVTGSATVGNSGDSYLVLNQSTGTQFTSDSSTKAFVPLDSTTSRIGDEWDVMVTSHAFINKRGGARIGYLWDYIQIPGFMLGDRRLND